MSRTRAPENIVTILSDDRNSECYCDEHSEVVAV